MVKNFFKNKSILITGGTGSFGSFFANHLSKKYKNLKKIVILSRDELKQSEFSKNNKSKLLRFFLGDVRDKDRLKMAFKDIDIVVHAAALKQVPTAEYNPFEFVKTNILGTQNVVEACLSTNVKYLLSLSTDKASSPTNLYGATQLSADKLVCATNNITGAKDIKCFVVRYGNVLGSRGSILDLFTESAEKGFINITDKTMTRFNITLNEAVKMVEWSLSNAKGGEIFVPKIPSFKIEDMATAINSKAKKNYVGIRPGEKIHEEMISKSDLNWTYDLGKYFAILNPSNQKLLNYYKKYKKIEMKNSYNSLENENYLSIKDLKKIISLSSK